MHLTIFSGGGGVPWPMPVMPEVSTIWPFAGAGTAGGRCSGNFRESYLALAI